MKIVTVVGARPQFVKAGTVSRAILNHNRDRNSNPIKEIILHTGQHYDSGMSQVFFDELEIPRPNYNLNVGSALHGEMTGRMLEGIETILVDEKPDRVLVYGDTNSTLAGALAAVKLRIPIAHVEAGLRSFNNAMPEEINRILTDRIASQLFCPTTEAVSNLRDEGIISGIHLVGDVMYDASLFYRDHAVEKTTIFDEQALVDKSYALATIHRAENTDNEKRLREIVKGLAMVAEKIPLLLPLHPRTNKCLEQYGLNQAMGKIRILEPIGYLDMVRLEQSAKAIFTDSGGVQKEAFFYKVPCITLRNETEWVETVDAGYNTLVEADADAIISAYDGVTDLPDLAASPYGKGSAAEKIVELLQAEI